MKTRLITAICAMATLPAFGAKTWEIDAGWARQDGSDSDSDLFGAQATYFLDPLAVGATAPREEAAFVERPRSLHVRYARLDGNESTGGLIGDADLEGDIFGLAYDHRRASSPHHFRIGYEYDSTSTEVNIPGPSAGTFSVDTKQHEVVLQYAYYVDDRLAAGVRAAVAEGDASSSGGNEADLRNTEITLFLRSLIALPGERWLSLTGGVGGRSSRLSADGERERDKSVVADLDTTFYFTRQTGLGLGVHIDDDGDAIGTELEWTHYFNDEVALEATLGRLFHRDADDLDVFSLSFRYRL